MHYKMRQVQRFQAVTLNFDFLREVRLGATGSEHPSNSAGNSSAGDQTGAKSGARPEDLDLAELINVWKSLPPVMADGILTMIRAVKSDNHS